MIIIITTSTTIIIIATIIILKSADCAQPLSSNLGEPGKSVTRKGT